jgi:hypothetical protein
MATMMSGLSGCNWSGRVWLDIEGSGYWLNNYANNWAWYKRLVNACMATSGVTCGIYSSQSQWVSLFGGSGYAYGSNLALWYPRYPYNQSPTFSDFQYFGGWTNPSIKQYVGSASACGANVDLDFSPSFY